MKSNGSPKKIVHAALDSETAERLAQLADERERSVSGEIRVAVRAHLAREGETRNHDLQEVA
jgi:predicted transcriptional regulator